MSQAQNKSQYELSRDERIKANLERMQVLGIADISLELKSQIQAKLAKKTFSSNRTSPSPIKKPGPIRRSSRLQNSTAVSYSEVPLGKKDEVRGSIMLEEGANPETYTEEHEKLLGHTEKCWTLFVDGYGADGKRVYDRVRGKRVYDRVRGKTCHQCRQKTLGHHTNCSQCNKVQGQFCGDCLYMRYGEHVLEAIDNPNWICPVCRGICNCSFCRTAKGLPPTGTMYRKILQLGYKSVAHYLIQTHRAEANLVPNPKTPKQVSARRSHPFSDTKEENLKADRDFKSGKDDEKQNYADLDVKNQTSAKKSLTFPSDTDHKIGDLLGSPKLQSESSILEDDAEIQVHCVDIKLGLCDSNVALGATSKFKKKRARDNEPSANSIAGRLRLRRQKGNLTEEKENIPDGEPHAIILSDSEVTTEKANLKHDDDRSANSENMKLFSDHDDDSQEANEILSEKEVQKQTCVLFSDTKHGGESSTALEGSLKLKKKHVLAAEPSTNSVAGRLKRRRRGN